TAIPAARWRSTPRYGGTYGSGSSHVARPRPDSATGPSRGTSTTTVAPRPAAESIAVNSRGSPASSPETRTTSRAPTHAGRVRARTGGGTAGPPTISARAATTPAAWRARSDRPDTQTTARGRNRSRASSAPPSTAVATVRSWAPAIDAWSRAPVASAARSASESSRSTRPAPVSLVRSGTDDREDLVDHRGDALPGRRLGVEAQQRLGVRGAEVEPRPVTEVHGHT